MTKISEPKIQRLEIARIDIDAGNRLRPVSEAGVQSLIASINELGVIKDPIHVRRKGRSHDAQLILMAGGHRLEAARQLGWDTIPARVWADVTDDFARLMEIDDNLSGADLSNLELSVFLAERKRVYERLHPQVKNGAQGGRGGKRNETEIISFSKSVAEKRELSDRHIRNFIQIGNTLSPSEIAELSGTKAPLKLKDLMALAKISEPKLRSAVVFQLVSGKANSVTEAVTRLQPDEPGPRLSADDAALQKLVMAWKRAPMKVRLRFVEDYGDALADIMAGKPELKVVS